MASFQSRSPAAGHRAPAAFRSASLLVLAVVAAAGPARDDGSRLVRAEVSPHGVEPMQPRERQEWTGPQPIGFAEMLRHDVPAGDVPASSWQGHNIGRQVEGEFRQQLAAHLAATDAKGLEVFTTKPAACQHGLSGVLDNVVEAIQKQTHPQMWPPGPTPSYVGPELRSLRARSYFIAANLHQATEVLHRWTAELLRLIIALGRRNRSSGGREVGRIENIFVSIYESGSTDGTKPRLQEFAQVLDFLGVPHLIVTGNVTLRYGEYRIDFLSRMRNFAIEPLMQSDMKYDRVLFLNDVHFCADGTLQLAFDALPPEEGGTGADVACGNDLMLRIGGDSDLRVPDCRFYDTWVEHTIDGESYSRDLSMSQGGEGENLDPFQVFSCWNGMAIFPAAAFQEKRLHLRRNRWHLGECAASEAELLGRDMWHAGFQKVVVSPRAAVAYHAKDFSKCAAARQPTAFHRSPTIDFKPAPMRLNCCPLLDDKRLVDASFCYYEFWQAEQVDGLPIAASVFRAWGRHLLLLALLASALWMLFGSSAVRGSLASATQLVAGGSAADAARAAREAACRSVGSAVLAGVLLDLVVGLALTALRVPFALRAARHITGAVTMLAVVGPRRLFNELCEKQDDAFQWMLLCSIFLLATLSTEFIYISRSGAQLLGAQGVLPLITAMMETYVVRRSQCPFTLKALLALNVVSVGSFLYSLCCLDDPQVGGKRPFDGLAPILIILHAAAATLCQLISRERFVNRHIGLSAGTLTFLREAFCAPFVCLVVAIMRKEHPRGDIHTLLQQDEDANVILVALALSCLLHVLHSYFTIDALQRMPATSVMVAGFAGRLGTILFVLLLGGGLLSTAGFCGAAALAASAWYCGVDHEVWVSRMAARSAKEALQEQKEVPSAAAR